LSTIQAFAPEHQAGFRVTFTSANSAATKKPLGTTMTVRSGRHGGFQRQKVMIESSLEIRVVND
jgi:hypothetical protein